ncbi:MAG: c-type cytochrome biogenesis protein CcmI [Alphaproteobacteria bacterium]|nr:c-type cytochrome biogenesis protein CcmI [Alphaproteobacteria bacterium]
MLWLIFALLTLATVAILLVPFVRAVSAEMPARIDYDVVVYRRQLKEIDDEVESGLLTEAQADAARAEVHRRMLAAEDAELEMPFKRPRGGSRLTKLGAVVAVALMMPVGAAIVYGVLGSPHLPGKPYAWRLKHDPDFVAASTADKLAKLLQDSPSASGYRRLAEMYFEARDYVKAVDAGRRAIDLGANDARIWSELGEAIVMMRGGAVMPGALSAFTDALSKDAHDYRARFYIGLAEAQIGNLKQAVAIWRDLEQGAPPAAPWLPMVREHITAVAKEGGFDPASVLPNPPTASSLNVANTAMINAIRLQARSKGPSGVDAPADSDVRPPPIGDQSDMIHAMVAGLADRMQTTPNDVAGWQRLAHAYKTLGEPDKARAAIDRAVRLKPADIGVQLTLAEIEKSTATPDDDTPADYIATLRTVLKLDPANVQALYYVGLAEMKAGHVARARRLWTKAVATAAPDDPLAMSARSRLERMQGKSDAD